MKLKIRIRKSIKNELSWAKDKAGTIIELDENDMICIGCRPELGVSIGGGIELKDLDLISYENTSKPEERYDYRLSKKQHKYY